MLLILKNVNKVMIILVLYYYKHVLHYFVNFFNAFENLRVLKIAGAHVQDFLSLRVRLIYLSLNFKILKFLFCVLLTTVQ